MIRSNNKACMGGTIVRIAHSRVRSNLERKLVISLNSFKKTVRTEFCV